MNRLPTACLALLTIALLPTNVSAQCEGQAAAQCAGQPAAQCEGQAAAQCEGQDAAQCEGQKAEQVASIRIPVTGLTVKNADQVAMLMQKVGLDPSECAMNKDGDACAQGKDCSGESCGDTCPMIVVSSARADVENGLVLLSVAPKKSVRLSQIAAALEDSSFAVDEQKLRLVGNVTLSVEGLTCGGCAGQATKAVQTVKGTKEINVVLESKEESFMNLTLDEGGVNYADVLAAMETTTYFIGDVSWTAPEATKVVAEKAAGGCCDGDASGTAIGG